MSMYLCLDHGVTGPMACCEKASRATVELDGQPVVSIAEATELAPDDGEWHCMTISSQDLKPAADSTHEGR